MECMRWLSVEQFSRLVLVALESEMEEKHRQEWIALLPLMLTADHYMSFDEYYSKVTGKNVDTRPADVIIAEIDRKHAEVKEKVRKNGT